MQSKLAGTSLERFYSEILHAEGVPLLLSAQTLRRLSCGQVDVARIHAIGTEKCIQLFEIKSTPRLSFKQKNRLKRTAHFLGALLDLPVQIKCLGPGGLKSGPAGPIAKRSLLH